MAGKHIMLRCPSAWSKMHICMLKAAYSCVYVQTPSLVHSTNCPSSDLESPSVHGWHMAYVLQNTST